ncbi:MAG: 16S rRNA (cytidine(1402)-2'-O)-methyltransferase [Alphaproteobacteria bacterium]
MDHPDGVYVAQKQALRAGLYIVATPIGNLGDITVRALNMLASATHIYCEDKRVSSKLLQHYGIDKPLRLYHDHNGAQIRPEIITAIQERQAAIVLISDAGTPLICDPGYKLVAEAAALGLYVTAIPGACAAITALSASGMPSDQFLFMGFMPAKPSIITQKLSAVTRVNATLIFYETASRLQAFLGLARQQLGNRQLVIARELTKYYEQHIRSTLDHLCDDFDGFNMPLKGEFCVLIGGEVIEDEGGHGMDQAQHQLEMLIDQELSAGRTVKQIQKQLQDHAKLDKRSLYQLILSRKT